MLSSILVSVSLLTAPPPTLPALAVPTQSGEILQLAAWRGRPVIVTFWATWCAACKQDLAALQRLASRPGLDIGILAIAVDSPGWRTVLPYLRQHDFHLPTTLLTPRLRKAFPLPPDVSPLPQTLFFAPNGQLAAHLRRALSEDELSRILTLLSTFSPN